MEMIERNNWKVFSKKIKSVLESSAGYDFQDVDGMLSVNMQLLAVPEWLIPFWVLLYIRNGFKSSEA